MSNEQAAVAQATEFSPTELAALRERREALSAQWVDAVRSEAATGKDGETSLEAGLSTEAQERIQRIQGEYEVVSATIKEHQQAKERSDLRQADEDLTAKAPDYRALQAKAEAEFYQNLIDAGRGKYTNPNPGNDVRGGAHPGSLPVPQPLIARNPRTGKNEVYPVNAVFSTSEDDKQNREANIEASFRQMEMVQADRFGEFDPITGKRLSDAPTSRQLVEAQDSLGFDQGNTITNVDRVATTYLNQGGMLYQYEIQRNELAQYMDIKQLPAVNDFLIDRRTAIGGDVGLVNEAGSISTIESTFDTLTFTPRKYAHLRGMTYESMMLREPWSVAETIMTDAGIAMGNILGKHIVTATGTGPGGNSMSAQWQGLRAWAQVSGDANNRSLGARGTFLSSSGSTFGIYELAQFVTSLPKEYFRAPNKLLSMSLATWGRLVGQEDTQGRKLFTSASSTEDMRLPDYNLRVVIDENWDSGTLNARDIPFFFGDFTSNCFVMYGPVRIDFSSEYQWTTDRLFWRFIMHRGFGVVDPNGQFGGRVT